MRVVERSLSKDPKARFESARAFLDALAPHWPRASAVVAPPPRSVRAPESKRTTGAVRKRASLFIDAFEAIALPISVGMVHVARFTDDGASALAIGPAGLARWTYDTGWSARELPADASVPLIYGMALGPNGEALVYGDGFAFMRAGAYASLDAAKGVRIAGAHVDHASHVVLAGSDTTSHAVIIESSPAGRVEHVIARGYEMNAVARASNGSLVGCGSRGTLCAIVGGKVHAHIAGRASLRAIAPIGEGFVAVGDDGALVHAAAATSDAIARANESKLADDDLLFVRTRAKFICAGGRALHVASLDSLSSVATAPVSGAIRDVWLGNGVVRILLDTAAVLEATIVAEPRNA